MEVREMSRKIGLTLAALLASQAEVSAAAAVGEKAPAVEPKEWLNSKEAVTWNQLKGRVILVEKWATW
jgi:hypothetical protein